MTEALEVSLLTRVNVNRDFSQARSASHAFLLDMRLQCLQGYPLVSWEDDYDVTNSLLETTVVITACPYTVATYIWMARLWRKARSWDRCRTTQLV